MADGEGGERTDLLHPQPLDDTHFPGMGRMHIHPPADGTHPDTLTHESPESIEHSIPRGFHRIGSFDLIRAVMYPFITPARRLTCLLDPFIGRDTNHCPRNPPKLSITTQVVCVGRGVCTYEGFQLAGQNSPAKLLPSLVMEMQCWGLLQI